MTDLQQENGAYQAHIAEWRKVHLGRFVVLHGDDVTGFFDSLPIAFAEGTKRYGLEPFLVRQILPEDPVNVSLLGAHLLTRK